MVVRTSKGYCRSNSRARYIKQISELVDRTGSGIGDDLENSCRIDKQMPSEFDQLFDINRESPIWQTLATTQLIETVFSVQPHVARNINVLKLM
jgi:hypothetical protein